jgi:hypothetical protein
MVAMLKANDTIGGTRNPLNGPSAPPTTIAAMPSLAFLCQCYQHGRLCSIPCRDLPCSLVLAGLGFFPSLLYFFPNQTSQEVTY